MRFLLCLVVALSACEPSKPRPPVEDPKAYLVEKTTADLDRCFKSKAEYCVDGNLDEVIASVQKSMHIDTLPTDPRELDRMVRRLSMKIRSNVTHDETIRNEVLQKVEARFRAPKSRVKKNVAFAHLGHYPGEFVPWRQSMQFQSKKDLMFGSTPSGDQIANAFERLRKKHPDVQSWAIRFKTDGTGGKNWLVVYNKSGGLSWIAGQNHAFSKLKISDDFRELRASQDWFKESVSCNNDDPDPGCKGGLPKWGFDDLF